MSRLIDIFFKTRSDAKGADKTKAGIKGATQEAQKAQGVFGRMRGKIDQLSQSGGAFGRIFGGALRALTSPLGLVVAGIAAITFALRKATQALKAFAEQELSETDLDSALAQMGMLTDGYRTKLHNLAGEMQNLTNVGDETWLRTFGQLTRFGMTSKNVDQVAEAVKNLAGLIGGDENSVRTATMLVQRALEGQFDLFTRYGITMKKTGDQAKDLQVLFALLAKKGGGMLEARAKTLSGQFAGLKNAFNDFKQAVGGVTAKTGMAQRIMGGLTKTFKRLEADIKPASEVLDGLSNKIKALEDISLDVIQTGAKTLTDQLSQAANQAQRVRENLEVLEDAELGRDIAKINLQMAGGKLSPEEGAWAKEQARLRVKTQRMEREHADKEAEIAAAEEAMLDIKETISDARWNARFAAMDRRKAEKRAKAKGVKPEAGPKEQKPLRWWEDAHSKEASERIRVWRQSDEEKEGNKKQTEERIKLLKELDDATQKSNKAVENANKLQAELVPQFKKLSDGMAQLEAEMNRFSIAEETLGLEWETGQQKYQTARKEQAEEKRKTSTAEALTLAEDEARKASTPQAKAGAAKKIRDLKLTEATSPAQKAHIENEYQMSLLETAKESAVKRAGAVLEQQRVEEQAAGLQFEGAKSAAGEKGLSAREGRARAGALQAARTRWGKEHADVEVAEAYAGKISETMDPAALANLIRSIEALGNNVSAALNKAAAAVNNVNAKVSQQSSQLKNGGLRTK